MTDGLDQVRRFASQAIAHQKADAGAAAMLAQHLRGKPELARSLAAAFFEANCLEFVIQTRAAIYASTAAGRGGVTIGDALAAKGMQIGTAAKAAPGGGGHRDGDTHPCSAPAANIGAAGADTRRSGQATHDTHPSGAAPSTVSQMPAQPAVGGGQTTSGTQEADASPSNLPATAGGAAQGSPDTQTLLGRPNLPTKQVQATIAGIEQSLLETMKVGGRRIGTLTARELLLSAEVDARQARQSFVQTRFKRLLCAGMSGNQIVGECNTPSDAARFWKQAQLGMEAINPPTIDAFKPHGYQEIRA